MNSSYRVLSILSALGAIYSWLLLMVHGNLWFYATSVGFAFFALACEYRYKAWREELVRLSLDEMVARIVRRDTDAGLADLLEPEDE